MKPTPNPMEAFCESLSQSVNNALQGGVAAPQIVMVLEMTKHEIADGHIQRMRMMAMQQQAQSMADKTPPPSNIITP